MTDTIPPPGLSSAEAAVRRLRHGANVLAASGRRGLLRIATAVATEPMFLLLLVAAGVYLLRGDLGDGLLLAAFALLSVALVVMQERRSERALEASFFVADVLTDPLPDRFDVIVSSLFLHHLDGADAETLLARLAASCRRLLLISDLLRTPLGYGLAWAGTQLLSRSHIVHIDGLLSVRGAFQLDEVAAMAERAGLHGVDLGRCWPERFLLRWAPTPAGPRA
jgi:hypothetical protein